MKNDLMGIILAENPEAGMGELVAVRSLAAVPFGGRYRIIDFVLSNMVNSSIINVGIATPYNYQSLSDHLGTGKPWDFGQKKERATDYSFFRRKRSPNPANSEAALIPSTESCTISQSQNRTMF